MQALLAEENEDYFSRDFPIFYKNKISKKDNRGNYQHLYETAIDRALKMN